MSSIVPLLREIHRLRKHIREVQSEIDRGPRVLKAHQAKLAKQEEAWKEAQESLKKLKVTVMERESQLKSATQQLARYEKQLDSVSDKKEYDAKKLEIANTRKRCSELEDEILNGLTEIDERTARLPEIEKQTQAAREEYARFEAEAKERQDRLLAELRLAEEQLRQAETQIPEKHRAQYDRLIHSYGADAFAAVQNKICQHCRTAVTLQMQTDLIKGLFTCCTSCGRVLYLPE